MTFRDESPDGKRNKRKRGRQCSEASAGSEKKKGEGGGLKVENLRRETPSALGFWGEVATLAKDDAAVCLCLKLSAEGTDGAEGTARRS